jgi:hypothetical protein
MEYPDEYEMCCGRARCPKISLKEDGIAITDAIGDSHGNELTVRISFNEEQARDLFKWLKSKGFDS